MTQPSCPHAFVLGVPGRGVHAARIAGTALWDWVFTGVLAFAIAAMAGGLGAWGPVQSAWGGQGSLRAGQWWGRFAIALVVVFFAVFLVGEVMHFAWGVDTAVLTSVGLARNCAPPPPPL